MPGNRSDQTSRRTFMSAAGTALIVPLASDSAAMGPRLQAPGEKGLHSLEGQGLYAGAFGVVGDGRTDDTRAVQAFLDLCAARGGRIAHFGAMSVRISGPLISRGVGIVFEPANYGEPGEPGFIAAGSGYTALTVLGMVADFCVAVTGEDGMDVTDVGQIAGDRRPAINGIAFGTDAVGEIFAMSTVRWVRVTNLAGFGVRHAQCWDSTFLSVSVERCGTADAYAFDVAASLPHCCNEVTWARLHVEQAVGGAIRVDPNTLSCSFLKIHSERALPVPGLVTWILGGSCTFDSTRLTAMKPEVALVLIVSNQADLRNLRVEGNVRTQINASGGVVNLHNPSALLEPSPNQNGVVNIVGGSIAVVGIGAGWHLFGSRISRLEVGFMPPGSSATLSGCMIEELAPTRGVTEGELMLEGSQVASALLSEKEGRLRALHLGRGSRLIPVGGMLRCTDQTVVVDATSRIEGDVVLARTTLRLSGTITGSLSVEGPVYDSRAHDGAAVLGVVSGWGPPTVKGTQGAWSVNLAPAPRPNGQGRLRVIAGWRYLADDWQPVDVEIRD
jgi:hypothetical protein